MVVRKMKEKCKDAARMRREKERAEFVELSKLLPLPSSTTSQLDKASIIRLTSSYLRLRSAFPQGLGRNWGRNHLDQTASLASKQQAHQLGASIELNQVRELGSLLLQTLDGFVFALHRDGKIMYISETASVHLGLPQIDLTGSSVFEFIHPSDHNDIHEILSLHDSDRGHLNSTLSHSSENNQYELPRSFCMRMKCILPKRNAGLVSSGYKAIHCNGYLKVMCKKEKDNPTKEGDLGVWESCALVAVGHSLLPSASTEVKLTSNSFMFRANLDLKLYYIEAPVIKLLGFQQMEMIGQSLYQFVHSADLASLDSSHRSLLEKGQVVTRYYRIMKKDGGFVWVQSYASLVNNPRNMPKPQHIVSVNLVLADNSDDLTAIHFHHKQMDSTHTTDAVLAMLSTVDNNGEQLNGNSLDKDKKLLPLSQRQYMGHQQKILRSKERHFACVKKARKLKSFDDSPSSTLLQPQTTGIAHPYGQQNGYQNVYLNSENSSLGTGHPQDHNHTIGSTRRLSDDSCSVVSSVASTNATSNISSLSLNHTKDFSSYTSLDVYTTISNENLISPQPPTIIQFTSSPNGSIINQVNESYNCQSTSGLLTYAHNYQYQAPTDGLLSSGSSNGRQFWTEINNNEQIEDSSIVPSVPQNQLNLIPSCNRVPSQSSYFQSTSDWLAQSNYSNQNILIDSPRSYNSTPLNYQHSDDRPFTEHNDIYSSYYNEAPPYLTIQNYNPQVPIKSGYEMSTT